MNGLPRILYDNRFKDAAPVASSTAAGDFNVLNLTDFRDYTWWKPNAMPATVTVDCGAAKSVDSWGLSGHNLGTLGVTVELRRSTDNFASNDILVDSYAPTNDKTFVRSIASISFNYWRLRFTGASAPSIAIAAAGVALEFPRRLASGFDPVGRKPEGLTNVSQKGHPLGSVLDYEEWSEKISFKNLDWSWVRANFIPAWKAHLRGSPFLFAWDPTDHADEAYLVSRRGGFSNPHYANKCDLSFEIAGRAE